MKTCSVKGCERRLQARGWCGTHYMRWHTHGTIADPGKSLAERFWEKVDQRGPDDCWPWLASVNRSGRPQFGMKRDGRPTMVPGARVAYELTYGAIAEDCDVHHWCFNKICVNPAHLEAISPSLNKSLGDGRTACKHGHPFNEKNSYIRADGRRQCRRCADRIQRERRARLNAARLDVAS